MPISKDEIFISVDVETSGPNPGNFSLLAIGACLVHDPEESFYIEVKPVNTAFTAEAIKVSQLDLEDLRQNGQTPQEAMRRFAAWVNAVTPPGYDPIFLAFNAAFDWMFVNDYFYRYLGYNPFGYKALDIKSFYMGASGVSFSKTSMKELYNKYPNIRQLSHHALQDAQDQARIFQILTNDIKNRSTSSTHT